jgi:hypothetical protein
MAAGCNGHSRARDFVSASDEQGCRKLRVEDRSKSWYNNKWVFTPVHLPGLVFFRFYRGPGLQPSTGPLFISDRHRRLKGILL